MSHTPPHGLVRATTREEPRLVQGSVQPHIPSLLTGESSPDRAVHMRPGHRMELVCNGDVFDVMERDIAQARASIHLCIYIWRPGRVSERLVAALAERARAGVACRLVVDAMGSGSDFEKHVRPVLERAGCEVRRFNPPRLHRFWRLMMRNHRKLLVIDGRVGLVGGWCISDEWDGHGRSEHEWRDTNVRVLGPAALVQMQATFSHDWQHAGGEPLPPDTFPALAPEGPARAAFIESRARPGAERSEQMLDKVFHAARQRLWISSGYFAINEAFTRLLVGLRRAGVDVRVLVPGPINDVPIARAMQRSTYRVLLQHGVRIWEYQPSMMHAKTAVVDEHLCLIGSTNLDPFSLNVLQEGSVVAEDPPLNAALARTFLSDLEVSREVHHSPWYYRLVAAVRRAIWWVFDRFD
ncbi:MAG: phospholipase D-like domain-containing protein [Cystobacter sp.]